MPAVGFTTPLNIPWPTPIMAPSRPPVFHPSSGFFHISLTPSKPSPTSLMASAMPEAIPLISFSLRIFLCRVTYSSSNVALFRSDAASPARDPTPSATHAKASPPIFIGTRGRFSNELRPRTTPRPVTRFSVYSFAKPREKSIREPRCNGTFLGGRNSGAPSRVNSSLKESTLKAVRIYSGKLRTFLSLTAHHKLSFTLLIIIDST
mmetsp:Transcript_53142/g.105542  ORF Transcript_53142/g.105542 Transcript_53142/m.105542 type:complete len:206 (-) Transcript_53142:284-901(-)